MVLPEIVREEAIAAVWRRERFGDGQRVWGLLCKEMVTSEWLEHSGLERSLITFYIIDIRSPWWSSLSRSLLLSPSGRDEPPNPPADAALQAGASA